MSEVCCNTVTVTVVNPVPVEVTAQAGTLVIVRDGTGAGDVVGPDVAVDGHVVVFDGTTGRVVKDGGELGSAAFADSADFASSAQGALADTAVQPDGLAAVVALIPTEAADIGAATATQGQAADTAVQPGDLPSFGDIVTRDASEFEAAGAAASAVSAHAGAADPHGDRAYAAGLFATNNALLFKGAIDCSSNPNYPAADCGWLYVASVAGKIGGGSGVTVEVGDFMLCTADSTVTGDQAAVGSFWRVIQTNLTGTVIGPAGTTDGYAVLFDGTTGRLIKAGSGPLGSAAYAATGDFATAGHNHAGVYDPAGTAAGLVDDLSGVSNASQARTNLGLGTAATANTGTGASDVILGNDSRLSDARTPTAHNHAASEVTSGTIAADRLGSGGGGAGAKVLADNQTWITPPAGYTDEQAVDAVATAIVTNPTHVGGITAAYDDPSNKITLTVARSVTINCCPQGTTLTTGDGKAYFEIPSTLNGLNLVSAAMTVITASSSGIPTFQIARGRASGAAAHTWVDMLATKLTVDSGEYRSATAATAAVIDTSNDDVATTDLVRLDCDVAGTGTQGVLITLGFC